jgi:hypothetical protein
MPIANPQILNWRFKYVVDDPKPVDPADVEPMWEVLLGRMALLEEQFSIITGRYSDQFRVQADFRATILSEEIDCLCEILFGTSRVIVDTADRTVCCFADRDRHARIMRRFDEN